MRIYSFGKRHIGMGHGDSTTCPACLFCRLHRTKCLESVAGNWQCVHEPPHPPRSCLYCMECLHISLMYGHWIVCKQLLHVCYHTFSMNVPIVVNYCRVCVGLVFCFLPEASETNLELYLK